jgi:arylsulfatase A-like enzyme
MNIPFKTETGLCISTLLCSTLSCAATAAAEGNSRPNIIFIMADDHALEAISCYGSWLKDYALTPNIDRIAAEGMRFNNVCCNNSICAPSRASIVTGQYSHKNDVPILSPAIINPASPLYPVEVKKAGYQTAIVGKWHLDTPATMYGYSCVTKGQGTYFNPAFIVDGVQQKSVTGYSSDVYTDRSLEWLEKRDKNKPFLLCLQFKACHGPWEYPERMKALFNGVRFPEPATLYEDLSQANSLIKSQHQQKLDGNKSYYQQRSKGKKSPFPPHDPNDPKSRLSAAYQHLILKYLRCVAAIDENVGRVLKYLDEQGLTENTIVIYTSDQGYWLGQHGMYDKRLILDPSLKMPFLIRYPKEIKAGTVCDEMCSNVDFAETFLDYAGAEIPATMQGRSMRPLLKGETPQDWPDAAFYNYPGDHPTHYGLRTKRYTLGFVLKNGWELYDNEKDPDQTRNLAANPEYASVLKELQQKFTELAGKLDVQKADLSGVRNWPIYEEKIKKPASEKGSKDTAD